MEELSCLFSKMSFITEMDKMGEVKMENERDLRNVMQLEEDLYQLLPYPKLKGGSKTLRLKVT